MALYYRCLQILLKKELKNFIDLFFSEGIRHDLTLIVKNNWVKLLSTDELQENHPKRQDRHARFDLHDLYFGPSATSIPHLHSRFDR